MMISFLVVFPEFIKNVLSTRNTFEGLFLKLTSDADTSVAGLPIHLSNNFRKISSSQEFLMKNCLSSGRSNPNEGVW